MAIQGVTSTGSLVAPNAAGALLLVDTAEAGYQGVIDTYVAKLANQANPNSVPAIPLGIAPIQYNGVPSNGTNAVYTATFGGTITGGSTRFGYGNESTGDIAWSATNATLVANILAAVNALNGVLPGDVTVAVGTMTAGVGTITLTAAVNLAKLAIPDFTVVSNDLTGTAPTVAIAATTPGVTATARGAVKGVQLLNTALGKLHINTGTNLEPTWTVVGAQS